MVTNLGVASMSTLLYSWSGSKLISSSFSLIFSSGFPAGINPE